MKRILLLVTAIPLLAELAIERQNTLVREYCAVCHSSGAMNGGLSLEGYDASQRNPALAAMILSKLRNGAMSAAGLRAPDRVEAAAWTAAAVAQSEGAREWTVIRNQTRVMASIVREVAPRKAASEAPLYRLTLACDTSSRMGEMQLTWSPEPQTDRTFTVSVDDGSPIEHRLSGRESMGNGSKGTTGRASALLNAPLAKSKLAVSDLFPREAIEFPLAAMPARAELSPCFEVR
ncbi:MAG: hypothetical protein U0Q16_36455 [Bryobacteraceae bacterium]